MEKSCGAVASRRGGEQRKPVSGKKKKMEPRAPETNPKRRRFGLVLFFFKIKTPQNDVVLGCLIFFLKNDTSKTTSFWASSNQNDAVLCVSP